jgi:H+/gluconate symporter-like permease
MTFKEVIKSFTLLEVIQGIVGMLIVLVAVCVGYVAMWCAR